MRNRSSSVAWWYALAIGVPAVTAAQLFAAGPLFYVIQLAGVAVVLCRRSHPGWRLLAAGHLAGVLATAFWTLGPVAPSNTPQGLTLVPLYTLAAAGTVRLTRRHRRVASPAELGVEAGAVVLGLAMVAWSFVVLPYLGAPGYQQVSNALAALYALIDLAVLGGALRALTGPWRTPARLLGMSGAALLGAHLLYAATDGDGTAPFLPGGTSFLLIQYAGVLVTAAALHPAADRLGVTEQRNTRTKLAGIVAIAIVGPLLPVLSRPTDAVAYVPATLTAALCGLLVLRIWLLARIAQRHARDAGERAAQLRASVDEQAALQRRLAYRAGHDTLTGLANRELLLEQLALPSVRDRAHCLLLCSLDGFKEVNDSYGHPVGDEVLRQLAGRLLLFAPEAVLVARLGGDEFGLLLTDPDQAVELAGRVLETVAGVPVTVGERRIHLTASAGLADGVPGNPPSVVLGDADLALRAAKVAGGARLARFDDSLRAQQSERARIAAGLRAGLADGSLFLHYQPVVDPATGRMTGVEALMRWRRDGELVPPMVFIPVAEQTGLIGQLGVLALRLACARGADWYRRHGIYVTVNVSTHQLRDPEFADTVLAVLAETGMPGTGLVLEITESVLVDAADTPVLGTLREHGIRIAIDDFGTGYSSLAYLRRLPVDILKIDRSFIDDVSFTRAILDLAHSQDLVTVAEGVETATQADQLRELRCDLVQGYHFGRPAEPEAIESLMRESSATAA
ncbi:bifunctional diguanylate cyclase/phosphodiesterase [Actinoplanes oblitus]|uniref:Bifunctional diguanylate cyclase/phosphodiesterase n=1 Tax=Actinoplanes oblitus TaxID=3040509 RepID=A0ABY8W9K2_9ACTN|nr:bifunctional diguanylate cyclase/phosphodiesterase [Actinoplanes oblitus]WIM93642.1 bifunctional diguanylate cyclase/phosphodiesterase [Actinoplanes oblitus]